MAVAEGFEPYSATFEASQNMLRPAEKHLRKSPQISVTVLKVCSKCAHRYPFSGFAVPFRLPRSAHTALVGSCHPITDDDWARALLPPIDENWWAWELAAPERFPAPIPYRGHLWIRPVATFWPQFPVNTGCQE